MPFALFPTAFGTCGVAWGDGRLTRFHLPEQSEELTRKRLASGGDTEAGAQQWPAWAAAVIARARKHFDGDMQDFSDVGLEWSLVSDFQRSVYLQTQRIQAGFKKSYGEIADALELGPGAARAVGFALATNPWPLIVPCHRVVSANDRMTGFSAPGGVRTKTRLLALEGAELLSE
jgi:methylated-DNA-[protein]-cysteine S-methyltransferase